MTEPTETEIRARIAEHGEWERKNAGHWHTLVFDCADGRELLRLLDEARSERDAARAQADHCAPWLSQAHALCADHGIPPGNISTRLTALAEKVDANLRNAERYQWLRLATSNCETLFRNPHDDPELKVETELDTAIDAAMQEPGRD